MKTKELSYSYKVFLGQYSTKEIGIVTTLSPTDDKEKCLDAMQKFVHSRALGLVREYEQSEAAIPAAPSTPISTSSKLREASKNAKVVGTGTEE